MTSRHDSHALTPLIAVHVAAVARTGGDPVGQWGSRPPTARSDRPQSGLTALSLRSPPTLDRNLNHNVNDISKRARPSDENIILRSDCSRLHGR